MQATQSPALLEQLTRQMTDAALRDLLSADQGRQPAGVVERIVFIGLSRRSAGDSFKDLRRCQVDRIGNRPSRALLSEFLPWLSGCIPVLTCCRFELHGILQADGDDPADEDLLEGFAALLGLPEEMRPLLQVRRGVEAVRHLIWTGLGGDSILLAETEITAQLKASYRYAVADGHLRRAPELHTLYQRAFHAIHALRDQHAIMGGWASSIQRLAFERLRDGLAEAGVQGGPETWRIGIVGAGQMAFQVANVLLREGLPLQRLSFYVRNRDRAMSKTHFPEGAEARPLHLLAGDLRSGRLDGLFGAVTHPVQMLQDAGLWRSLPRACVAIDLSVPPMFDPAAFSVSVPKLRYVGFEELMARQGARLDDVRQRLAIVRRHACEEADRLAADIGRREALRSVPLEEARRALRERLGGSAKGPIPEVERMLDEALAERGSERDSDRTQRQRIRKRMLGIIRHQAIEALKSSLIPGRS